MILPTNLIKFFQNLGLDENQTKICVSLSSDGRQSMLNLARKTGINRTTVYRLCEELQQKKLVQILKEEKRVEAEMQDLPALREAIKTKEDELSEIKALFPQIESYLKSSEDIEQTGTKVIFYRGKENIKQLFWNTLKSEKEILGYTYRDSTEIIGEEFSLKWHEEFITRGLVIRHIYSDNYKHGELENALTELLKKKYVHFDAHFKERYISSNVLDITTQIDIYNNVVAYYRWYMDEVYAVEIHNKELANMQRQIFEIVWERAGKI